MKVISTFTDDLVSFFPSRSSIAKRRTEINGEVRQEFGVHELSKDSSIIGHGCTLLSALKSIVSIQTKSGVCPDVCYFKLSGDGRRDMTYREGVSIFTINPINCSSFPSQSRTSVIPLLLWKGQELLAKEFSCDIFSELQQLIGNGGAFDSISNNRGEFIWFSDLAFLNDMAVCIMTTNFVLIVLLGRMNRMFIIRTIPNELY